MNTDKNQQPDQESFRSAFIKPFKNNWSETIHYILISSAIVISALWAVWTFNVFSQRDKALQDLENAQNELVKKKAEIQEIQERLDGNFSSDIDLSVEIIKLKKQKFALIIDVAVKNVGSNDVILNLQNKPLTVYKLRHQEDKLMATKIFKPLYYEKLSYSSKTSNKIFTIQKVLVGATKNINFFTEVNEKGMYYITFEASLDDKHIKRLESDSNDHVWFASTYVNVGN